MAPRHCAVCERRGPYRPLSWRQKGAGLRCAGKRPLRPAAEGPDETAGGRAESEAGCSALGSECPSPSRRRRGLERPPDVRRRAASGRACRQECAAFFPLIFLPASPGSAPCAARRQALPGGSILTPLFRALHALAADDCGGRRSFAAFARLSFVHIAVSSNQATAADSQPIHPIQKRIGRTLR